MHQKQESMHLVTGTQCLNQLSSGQNFGASRFVTGLLIRNPIGVRIANLPRDDYFLAL